MAIVINSTTGEIDVASSTPGTYRITYTTNGDCPNSSTQDITINALPTISITASSTSICAGDSVTLTASGAGAGGSYSWSDGQSTAAITVTPGATITYSVTGTDANGCFNTASQQITVTAVDTATVTYSASAYCQMPTGALAVDGYYPLYATESAAQAESSDGTAHAHTLSGTTYYMPNDGVIIYHGTYSLTTPAPTITGQSGTFSESTGNLSIDSSTGVINVNNSTAGTYTVVYTTNGSCPNTVNNTITVNALDGATFAYSSNSLPQTGTASLTTTPTTSGGVYSAYPSGLSINSSTGEIDLAASTIQSYKIFYETSGAGCPNSSTFDLAVTASGIANNYSMNFDAASSDYIDAGSSVGVIGTGVRTFSVWLKTSSNAIQTILGTRNVNTDGWVIQVEGTIYGTPNILFYNSKSPNARIQTLLNVADGIWHHIVIVRAGSGNNKIYVDGVSQTLSNGSENLTDPSQTLSNGSENLTDPQSSKNLLIGAGYNTGGALYRFFDGKIDEVAIWNTALTDGTGGTVNQIAEIYNATSTNLTKDLTTVSGSNLIYWNRMGD
jgi:hypothetical protein